MQIVVLIKQVPDMNAVKIDRTSGKPVLGDQKVVSSFDEYAVEAALQLKEQRGGEVTVVSAGGPSVKDAITRALAMGADKAVQITLPERDDVDTLALASILADEVRKLAPDVVLVGQNSDDSHTGHIGPQLAELLGMPHLSSVTRVEGEDGAFRVQRDTEDGKQVVAASPPVLLMAMTGLNEPRLPSIKGMMAAKRKPVEQVTATAPSSPRRLLWGEPFIPERTVTGTIVQGLPPADAAKQLVGWLKEQKLL
ncbi:MAG: electron transfer flavoprotein subunit beta/FixA family protein [Chloroflexota bacterium]|nr:electron transfer flavoprotein subunit beta/FixA family protein [Chloroflexota bacterium]